MAEARTMSVSFACQRCLQPLLLDDSFGHMSEYALAELDLPIYSHFEAPATTAAAAATTSSVSPAAAAATAISRPSDPAAASASPPSAAAAAVAATTNTTTTSLATDPDHCVPPFRLTESDTTGTNGFMLVSDGRHTQTLGATLRARAALFDALSANSACDHPLCDECCDTLLELMDKQLAAADTEWHDYSAYLQRLERQQQTAPDLQRLEAQLAELAAEEQRMLAELDRLRQTDAAVQANIRLKTEERRRLDDEEEKFRREYTKYRRDLMLTEDDYRSLECQIAYAQSQWDKLKKTNVFNVTFHIWHAGHFGTINTFRLGRLPSAPVDWSEINAAWGQTALLLAALARKVGLVFRRYRLVPFGNHSYIEVLGEGGKELPLYGTGGFKFFWDTKFDAAMVAFLDCLTQFKEEVERGDSGFCLPYRMDKGKIEDSSTGNSYSIKIQFNSEEQWTKALKFLLTNLKWGLAWVSSQFGEVGEEDLEAVVGSATAATQQQQQHEASPAAAAK